MSETEILWIEDPLKYPYLREVLTFDDEPKDDDREKVIGYSKGNGICHRLWYWMPNYDGKGPYESKLCPCEAVVPSSVRINACSLKYGPVLARMNGFEVEDRYSEVAKSDLLEPLPEWMRGIEFCDN